jgi:hypothetical protein
MAAVEEAFAAVEADSTVVAGAFVAGLAAVADSAAEVAFVAGLAVEATMEGLEAITAGAGAVMADSIITTAAGGETASSSALVTPGTTGPGRTMAMADIPITRTTGAILTDLIPAARMATIRI